MNERKQTFKDAFETLAKINNAESLSKKEISTINFIKDETAYTQDARIRENDAVTFIDLDITTLFDTLLTRCMQKRYYRMPLASNAFNDYMWTVGALLQNATDASTLLCNHCLRSSLPGRVFGWLDNELKADALHVLDEDARQTCVFTVVGFLTFLFNLVTKSTALVEDEASGVQVDARTAFRNYGVVNKLQPYLAPCFGQLLRSNALVLLVYVVNEEDSGAINADLDNLRFLLSISRHAFTSDGYTSATYAYSLIEMLDVLAKLLTIESNKSKMADLGVVEHYAEVLCEWATPRACKVSVLTGLFHLSFDQHCVKKLRSVSGLLDVIKQLKAEYPNSEVEKGADGVIWLLDTSSNVNENIHGQLKKQVDSFVQRIGKHIMLSYQWDAQEQMIRIKEILEAHGYNVWMDVDQMSGSTLTSMAEAVENARLVIFGMSQKYKESANCRLEAEYTFKKRVDFIPLKLQSQYEPDGWFGILTGSKLYFDFSSNDSFLLTGVNLLKEIDRICPQDTTDQLNRSAPAEKIVKKEEPKNEGASAKNIVAISWKREDVQSWLEEIGLSKLKKRFKKIDGILLHEYSDVQKTMPEFFLKSLNHSLRLDVQDMLIFSHELRKLF